MDTKRTSEARSDSARNPSGEGIPQGLRSLTPHLTLSDCERASRFYRKALGAVELYRLRARDGRIAHAELQIGDYRIMICDEAPARGLKSARSFGGSPMSLCVYSDDVDALARRFVRAGGIIVQPLVERFYGDRSGQFEDPEGYRWILSQRIEDVSPEEMARRAGVLRVE